LTIRATSSFSSAGKLAIGTSTNETVGFVASSSNLGASSAYVAEYDLGAVSSGSVNVDWTDANQQRVTLAGSQITMNFTGGHVGSVLRLIVCQDATGSRDIISWDSSVAWAATATTTQTARGGNCDIFSFLASMATGSVKYFGVATVDF